MTSRKQYSPWRNRLAIVATGFAALGAFNVAKATVADAAVPAVSVYNVHKAEGHVGSSGMPFSVKLSMASPAAQWVQLQPVTGGATPATAGKDFNGAGPFLVNFAPGETAKVVNVPVFGDTLDEYNETFLLKIVAKSPGINIGDGEGQAMITDDDNAPFATINDVGKKEGTGGITQFVFTVKLSAASGKTVKVNAVGESMGAKIPEDLTAGPVALTFAPGVTQRTYTAHVNGDNKFEPNETFHVALTSATDALIADNTGVGTIQNDDFLVAEPPKPPKEDPKPDPKPEPQPDNGNGGGGSNGGGGNSGGAAVGGAGSSAPAGDTSTDPVAGEGEQALGESALTEARPADTKIDWMTSAMLTLLGMCVLGMVWLAFAIARRRRNEQEQQA